MKKIIASALAVICALTLFTGCCLSNDTEESSAAEEYTDYDDLSKEKHFYRAVADARVLIDSVADDICEYWFECMYEYEFRNEIDHAVSLALFENETALNALETRNIEIKELYTEIKFGVLEHEAKAVMKAYEDYYSLIADINGPFKTYSEEITSCRNRLTYELYYFSIAYIFSVTDDTARKVNPKS